MNTHESKFAVWLLEFEIWNLLATLSVVCTLQLVTSIILKIFTVNCKPFTVNSRPQGGLILSNMAVEGSIWQKKKMIEANLSQVKG